MSKFIPFKKYTLKQVEIAHELARRGTLRHLLHVQQRHFYDACFGTKDQYEFFFYSCRKMGKSYALAVIGVEHCLRRSDAIVRHVFPQLNTAKETMAVIMNEIMAALPEELKPTLRRQDNKWLFPNGSQYCLGGALPENIAGLRGPYCTLLLADELCFWKDSTFNECLYGTLLAQTSLIPDARLIYASTPPEQITHPAVTEIMPKLIAKKAFFKYNVYDNPLLDEAQIEKLKELCGGGHTRAWRREYLAELIADDSRRVVPAFDADIHAHSNTLPALNEIGIDIPYVGMVIGDYGLVDGTGILGCLFNPHDGTLYVEYEVFSKGEGLRWLDDQLNEVCRKVETHKLSRKIEIIDMFEQASRELRTEYGRDFRRPIKDKVESQVALVNSAFETGRLKIHKRCEILIKMLENGLWKDSEVTKKFERTEELLHLDLIAALCYAVKACPWRSVGQVSAADKYQKLTIGRPRR
jgi:hypothetical protein